MKRKTPSSIDETVPLSSKGTPAPLAALVVVESDVPAAPRSFRLVPGAICRVGSGPDAELVIRDPTVSRNHVELSLTHDGVSVVDLGSRNGTFYLGQRVERIVLALGSRLEVGAARISFQVDRDALEQSLAYEGDSYRGVLGESPAMRRLFALLTRLEGSLASVLVEGESGVGKERIASAIHEGSSVSQGPLVTLNCGALPRDLVASELFGHKKGAFTGAVEAREGAFVSADGGTLFLDEVGELPVDVQPMLLRALESGEVRALGEDLAGRVSVRIVAATNRDLERDVQESRFREDLFYRLAVVRIHVPPLRERPEDVPSLARVFAQRAGLEDIPADVIEELKQRAWPGNGRELRNFVQAYAALGVLPRATRSTSGTLDRALRELADLSRPYAEQKDELVERFTAIYLSLLMDASGGNQTAAARQAGIHRGHLGELLAKHGLGRSRGS